MALMRNYLTLYGVHLNHWSESWNSEVYNKVLVAEYYDDDMYTSGSTLITSTVSSVTFLYPPLIDSVYFVDGYVEGHFRLFNNSGTGSTIVGYTTSLLKIPDYGSMSVLGSNTNTLSTAYTLGNNKYVAFPIKFNVSKQQVSPSEKLALRLAVDGGVNRIKFMHWNDSTTNDLKVSIPIAPEE